MDGITRLKITLTLDKLSLTDDNDTNFVELMRINLGNTLSGLTEYSVLGDTLVEELMTNLDIMLLEILDDIRSLNDGINNGVFDDRCSNWWWWNNFRWFA